MKLSIYYLAFVNENPKSSDKYAFNALLKAKIYS